MTSSQWDRFATAEARERIIRQQVQNDELQLWPQALIAGWDSVADLGAIDPPNGGVWRTPHFDPAQFFGGVGEAPLGIFEGVASPDDLSARIWRLIRILPDATDERLGVEDFGRQCWEDEQNASEKDIFATRTDEPITHRDHFIASIFGHSLRDHAEFLFDLRHKEPELGALVLKKRFVDALALDIDLLKRPWPSSVRRRWASENLDYLPPFAHAMLVADCQRLAQNVCSQIAASYFESGKEANLAATAKECGRYQKLSDRARPASITYDAAIAAQIDMQPFQSLAVIAPGSTLLNGDADLATNQTLSSAHRLHKNFVTYGRTLTDFVSGDHDASPSALLAKGLMNHLDRAPDRKAKGGSLAHRGDFTATYWGMNWLTHSYVGLWQLARFAELYNKQWRPQGPRISQRANSAVGRRVGLIQSIARIPYFWLETTNPSAFRMTSEKLAKSSIANALTRAVRTREVAAGIKLSAIEREAIADELKDRYEVLSIFDDEHVTIKERDVTRAKSIAVKTPPAGMPGYTAQYRPHLWFDQCNDDIGFWIGRELGSRHGPFRSPVTNETTPSAKALRGIILSDIYRYRNCAPGIAAKVNQNLAMTFGAFASDPQHSWFRRKRI